MQFSQKIAPCLWFASEAEEAARYYTGIFPDSKIGKIARYGKAGFEQHQQK
jgi:predicted 3-demethylubiquinone-9 3-methyltransferase (glyoxalase superfamily)